MTDDAPADSPNKPHDALFHVAFSRPENARDELRAVLPPALFEALDTNALAVEPDHFVEPELSELESDLLFSVPLRGRKAYVYVLVEHQSSPDPLMPWRMLQYLVKVWQRVLKNEPSRKLPLVVPIVIAHVDGGWNAPTTLLDLLDLDEPLREVVRPFVPDFRFLLDDLARVPDHELDSGREAGPYVRLVWLLLKHARSSDDLLDELDAWVPHVVALLRDPGRAEDFLAVLVYIRTVTDVPPERLRDFFRERIGPQVEESVSAVEKMLEATRPLWIAKARAEARAEDRAEGQAEGEARVLLKILTKRFGPLSDRQLALLESASLEDLERWSDRVMSEASIDDVLR